MENNNTLVCPKCGCLNNEVANFCKACGTSMAEVKAAVMVPQSVTTPQSPQPEIAPAAPFQSAKPEESEVPFQPATTPQPEITPASPFKPVKEESVDVKVEETEKVVVAPYVEEKSIWAEELPQWSIVPPQIVVRRKRSR